MRTAFSRMVSNTGASSPGERDNLENLRGRRLLLQRLGKVLPSLGELEGPFVELLLQIGHCSAARCCAELATARRQQG